MPIDMAQLLARHSRAGMNRIGRRHVKEGGIMKPKALLALFAAGMMLIAGSGAAWNLPPDRGTLDAAGVEAILAGNEYPETSDFTQKIEMIDFTAYGQKFTQVAVVLTPDRPRLVHGRRLVVVGGEPGSEYGMDFVRTVEDKAGPAVWLAKRGVTFIALTRVGRWNFLAPTHDGSWASVPIGERMPIYNRNQTSYWPRSAYVVEDSGKAATSGDSAVYRLPKPGTLLYKQMLAATADTFLTGYRLALERALPDRDRAFVLFWGMSTGGAFLYPLARHYRPDGYLGWGTSSTGLASVYRRVRSGDYAPPYARTAMRLRERGLDDFVYYTKDLDPATRARWWQRALRSPRFKSTEDASMQFGSAALTESAFRLWTSDFLPAKYREAGLARFVREMLEPSFPPAELDTIAILDLNGTRDEAIPPGSVDLDREIMEPFARKYRVGRVEGLHHYLFTQESIKLVTTLWLKYIDSGYFDQK